MRTFKAKAVLSGSWGRMPSSTVTGTNFFGVDGRRDSCEPAVESRACTSHENECGLSVEARLVREERLMSDVDHPKSTCFPFFDDLGASGAWRMLDEVGGLRGPVEGCAPILLDELPGEGQR